MTVTSTVLFGAPHSAIAGLIRGKIAASTSTRIVSGFATRGGLSAIDTPVRADPAKLRTLVVGACTYPAFQALDGLLSAGVAPGGLWVHLGHSAPTGGAKHPFARYRPMMHSKIYYMDLPGSAACAFVGSHNVTSFALGGLNAEAAVMLEGPADAAQFEEVRRHIDAIQGEAVPYDPAHKEAYAWWLKDYIDGLDAEIALPREWRSVRTILIFAKAQGTALPRVAEELYFELPRGIQIETLRTEVHLFVFDALPATPWATLAAVGSARAKFTCATLGADNEQGNAEVKVKWRIEQAPHPVLLPVPTGRYRPSTPPDMQQVRAKVSEPKVAPFEYAFERESIGWAPVLAPDRSIRPAANLLNALALVEARGGDRVAGNWRLVAGLEPRSKLPALFDQAALALARPESGSFVLVALRRRDARQKRDAETDREVGR